ncbi:hypothetical protein BDN67DRAFT_1010751 [Paxillus ammoniavirescens]|nr:hypothetical protein BDN67DRAFT_1010751 [Paxillus ammoniavirescens]
MSGTYKNSQPLPAIPKHLLPIKKHHLRAMAAYIAENPEANVDIKIASISSARVSTPILVMSSPNIDIHSRVTQLEVTVAEQRGEIQGINVKLVNLDTKVDTLATKVDALATKVDALATKVDALATNVDALLVQFQRMMMHIS